MSIRNPAVRALELRGVPSRKRTSRHLSTRIFGQVLAIHRPKFEVILHAIGPRLGLSDESVAVFADDFGLDDERDDKSYDVTDDGIVCIPISGTLVQKAMGMSAMSGLTSYSEIRENIEDAATDPAVKAVLLDFDSCGGEVSGMLDLADFIYSVRAWKPFAAVANDDCYSAAYALASAAGQLFVTRTGGVGSIGCFMCHRDQSEADKMNGLKYTYLFDGEKKVDGNPHEPLSDRARADDQAEVERIKGMFIQAVARNRAVSADELTATQSGIFHAQDAVPLLADAVGTRQDALAYLRAKIGAQPGERSDKPSVKPKPGTADIGDPLPHERALIQDLNWLALVSKAASTGWAERELESPQTLMAVRRFESSSVPAQKDRSISLLVVPYNSPSSDLGGFKEVYQPGCFQGGLDRDPRVSFNHDPNYILGRKSADTATFWEDAAGLHVDCDPPEAQWADDLLVSMRRGDITQASAAFWIVQQRWEYRGQEKFRIVEKAIMREASVASFACYESTNAAAKPTEAAAKIDLSQYRMRLNRARLGLVKSGISTRKEAV